METSKSVSITINSKCPRKWAFVDMETGDVWVNNSRLPKRDRHHPYTFVRADNNALLALDNIMTQIKMEE